MSTPITTTSKRVSTGANSLHVLGVEAALATVTVTCGVVLTRLFADTSFLRDAIAMGLASHLVAAASRRCGLRLWAATPVSAVCLMLTVSVLRYSHTSWLLLPSRATFEHLLADLEEAADVAFGMRAPLDPVAGLTLASGTLLWMVAFMSDTAALRARAPLTAVAPGAAIVVAVAVAGTPNSIVVHSAAFCAASAAVLVALRLWERNGDDWIETRAGRGTRAMGRAGVALASVAVIAGVVIGPRLPHADAPALVDLANLEVGDGARVVLSPLVQVRSRLVHSSNVELFSVGVPEQERHYWRLMSLDHFDGDAWRARSRFSDALGLLPTTLDPSVQSPPVTQDMHITRLGNDYLPAAHELRRVVDDGGVPMRYEADSGALIMARDAGASLGSFRYRVESVVVDISDPDVLRAADKASLDADFLEINTALPDEVHELVGGEARRVTAGAASDYQRALQLQDYFWVSGNFAYDLNVAESRNIDDLEDFLFETRAGYCEQFASAFAAMARSVGLPTRVAVGFTWGEWDPGRGVYAVRGEHAHAWPEVYFAGVGWVRFEPTPGRGGPDDFAVTGRVADQAGYDPSVPTAAPRPSWDQVAEGFRPDLGGGSGFAGASRPPEQAAPEPVTSESTPSRVVLWAALAMVGLVAVVGTVPAMRMVVVRRRRAAVAGDPARLLELNWSQAVMALKLLGVVAKPSETPLELARRVRRTKSLSKGLDELAALATHARYARSTSTDAALRAALLSARVVESCRRQIGLGRRIAAALNPATVFS